MSKHKLNELQKIIEEKIGSLNEEVEIGTNLKLNPLHMAPPRRKSFSNGLPEDEMDRNSAGDCYQQQLLIEVNY
jgi:hypothetical protein